MSTTVDQRVVEMRFDNKHFEQNVSTTMSTLDKLKRSLNFAGASKGLDNVNAAAKGVNMSGLMNSVDTVRTKFSALEVMGVTALANITNSAVNAGKRIVSALTIDPVKTGFQEYETQINATQTILANTKSKGSTIHDVNKALEELNRYADMTIYNFTEMTRNIGTFTAAGIDLQTSVDSIQGIANLAAISGSTSQQASTAMYQLSQALASGTVKLMDWNSVVNAGMGGEMFQNALKETSRLLGTGADAAIEAEGSFRESLRTGWLTAEVLTKTLKSFTTSGANERVAEFTGLSLEAVEASLRAAEAQYGEAKAIEYASKAMSEKTGKSADEIKAILEFANDAVKAATEVKTFTQLWDVMKESVQSGWAQTWKIIVGDFDGARELLTPLADFITGFLNGISDARNKFIESVLSFTTPWKRIMDKLDTAGLGTVKKMVENVEDMTDKMEYFQEVVSKVWRGDYGNSDTGRYELLEAAGYNHKVVQDLVNLGIEHKLTVEDIEKSHEKFGLTIKETANDTQDLTDVLSNLTDEQLKAAGLTEEEIKLFRDLAAESKRTGKSISEIAEAMSTVDGRTLIIESFKNVGSTLVSIFRTIGAAWDDTFESMSAVRLYGVIRSIEEFTARVKEWGSNSDTIDKLTRTFKGLFAILDIVATVLGSGFKIAFEVLRAVLSYFNMDILDLTAEIGDILVMFRDWIDRVLDVDAAVDALIPLIERGAEAIRGWWKSLKGTDGFNNLINFLSRTKEAIFDWLKGIKGADDVPKYIISGLVNGLKNGTRIVVDAIVTVGKALIQGFCDIFGIQSPSTVFFALGGFIIAGLIGGLLSGNGDIKGAIETLGSNIVTWFGNIDFGSIFAGILSIGITGATIKLASAIKALSSPLEGLGDVLSGTGAVLEKSARPIAKTIKSVSKVIKSFARVMNAISFDIATNGIKNLAISLAIMVASVIALAVIGKNYDLWGAMSIIVTLAATLAILAMITNGLSQSAVTIGKNGVAVNNLKSGLLAIAAAILLLGITVKMIGTMDPDQADRGFQGLISIVLTIGIFLAIYGSIAKSGGTADIDKAGGTILKIAGAVAIIAIVAKLLGNMEWYEFGRAAAGLGIFLAFAAILVLIGKIPGSNINKLGNNLMKIAGGIAILAIVAKLLSGMTWGEMGRAAVGLAGLLGVVALLMLIAMIPGKSLEMLGNNILKLSASIAMLSISAKILSSMSWGDMGKAAVGLVGLAAIVLGMILVTSTISTKELVKVGSTLLLMSVSIGILAVVLTLLGFLEWEHINKGITAVGGLAMVMALLVVATSVAQKCVGTVVALTVAIAVITAAVIALSYVDPEKLTGAVTALGIVIGIFALLLLATSKAQGSLGTLIVMTVAIGVLGGVLYLIGTLPIDSALSAAGALSILLLALTAVLFLLGKIGAQAISAIPGMIALAAMGLLVWEFAVILKKMNGIENAIQNVLAISILMAAMTGVLALLGLIGGLIVTAAVGMLGLAAMGLVMWEFIAILKTMNGIENVNANVIAIVTLMTTLTLLMVPLMLVGALWPAAAIGLIALAAMGLPLIEFIAILKSMEDMTSAAENVTILTMLMTALTGTLAVIAAIGPMAIVAVASIAALAAFSDELPKLGTNLRDFATNLGTFNEAQIATVLCGLNAIGVIAEAASKIDGQTELGKKLFGDNSITAFSGKFPKLGSDLKEFADNLGSFDDSKIATVSCAVDVIKVMADMAKGVGEGVAMDSVTDFVSKLPTLGTNVKDFAGNLGEFGESQYTTVTWAVKAISAIADIAHSVNTRADWAKSVFGDNSLATFVSNLPDIGDDLTTFASKLGTFGETQYTSVTWAVKTISEMSNISGKTNIRADWAKTVFGDNSLKTFVAQLPDIANDLNSFNSNLGEFDGTRVGAVVTAIEGFAVLADANLKSANKQLSDFGDNTVSLAKDMAEFCKEMPSVNSVKSATDSISTVINTLGGIASSGTKNIKDFSKALKDVAKSGVKTFVDSLGSVTVKTDVKNAGIDMMNKLVDGIKSKLNTLKNTFAKVASTGITALKDDYTSFYNAGVYLVSGFANGIKNNKSKAVAEAQAMVTAVKSIVQESLKINSPSKVFMEIGSAIPEGFALGINEFGNGITNAAQGMSQTAIASVRESLARATDMISSGIDAQPTIRPVLDLSDVESGAGRINSLFTGIASVGVMANVGSISSMMNSSQNGTNDDVIAELAKLGNKLDNVKGNSYSINGVTYNDNSELSDAFKTIVRYAQIERRS